MRELDHGVDERLIDVEGVDEELIEAEEDLVIDAQFLIQELMNEHGISRAELARRAGVSKARLTQLMRSEANPTLRTLAKLAYVMGDRLCVARKSSAPHAIRVDGSWLNASDDVYSRMAATVAPAELNVLYERWRSRRPPIASRELLERVEVCNDNTVAEEAPELQLAAVG